MLKEILFFLFYFVAVPAIGLLAGWKLTQPAVLSGKVALALAAVPLAGAGLTPVFC